MKTKLLYASTLLALAAPAISGATQAEVDAYSASKYTYCDAKMLSSLWGQSVWEAKERIGRKIGWGDQAVLNGMMGQARSQALVHPERGCAFHETQFTYNDAQVLAKIWNLSVLDAKAFVEEKIITGHEALVTQLLAKNRRKNPRS